MWAESTVSAIRATCDERDERDELAGWQRVGAWWAGAGVVIDVALAHAWSAAWSTAVTIGAGPGSGCASSGPCDAAMFHPNAKTTPTSTGPRVETSPIRPRWPGSPRGLDPRCAASPPVTGEEHTSELNPHPLASPKGNYSATECPTGSPAAAWNPRAPPVWLMHARRSALLPHLPPQARTTSQPGIAGPQRTSGSGHAEGTRIENQGRAARPRASIGDRRGSGGSKLGRSEAWWTSVRFRASLVLCCSGRCRM